MSEAPKKGFRTLLSRWRYCLGLVPGLCALPFDLAAQRVSPGFAIGVAIPTGRYGETRSFGPLSQLSLAFRDPESKVRFRLEAEGAWFPGREQASGSASSSQGDLRILSILGTVLLAPGIPGVRPYVGVGAGRHWLRVPGSVNPYGAVFGVRAAVGLEGGWGDRRWKAEVGTHAVLSDYATGRDFAVGTYLPFMVGMQF